MSRRQQAQHDKQQRITAAAVALFHAQGFDATTVEQVAERADVAKGTVFLYAPSKPHLLLLVYENDLAEAVVNAFADIAPDAPVVDTLANIFGHFFQLYERDVALAQRFVREQLFLRPTGRQTTDALAELLARLAALIQDWQAAGRVAADLDARLAAQTTFALYFVVLLGWLSRRTALAERDAALRASLALHWRGLMIDD